MSSNDNDSTPRRGAKLILGGLAAGAVLGTVVAAPSAQASGPAPTDGGPPAIDAERASAVPDRVDADAVSSLAAKLDGLELSSAERAVLTRLLSVAADEIRQSADGDQVAAADARPAATAARAQGTTPSFREQFESAFRPGPLPTVPDEATIIVVNL